MADLKSQSTEGGSNILTTNLYSFSGSANATTRYLSRDATTGNISWVDAPNNIILSQDASYNSILSVVLSPVSANIAEPDHDTYSSNIVYSVEASNVSTSTNIYWSISHGTSSAEDFISPTSGILTFSPSSSPVTRTFPVAIDSDSLFTEGLETFSIELRKDDSSGEILLASNTKYISDVEGYTYHGTSYGYSLGGEHSFFSPIYRPTMVKFSFASDVNGSFIGNLSQGKSLAAGHSSEDYGYAAGGFSPPNTSGIDRHPFSTDTGGTDVGDLTSTRRDVAGQNSQSTAYVTGGAGGPGLALNTIDKFPFSSVSSCADIADLSQARRGAVGQSSEFYGYSSGGSPPSPSTFLNTIDKFPFSSDSNATDVGNLSQSRKYASGQSSLENGYISGGQITASASSNRIDKFSFSSDTNASYIAVLSASVKGSAGNSSDTSGYATGGIDSSLRNEIEKFPFSTNSPASSSASLSQSATYAVGTHV